MLSTTHYIAAMVAAVLLLADPVHANEELVKKHGCVTCHALDRKMVGPTWKDVAARYKGDAKAVDTLTERVKAGGKGVWGQVPMPPQNKVSDADLKLIMAWILAQ